MMAGERYIKAGLALIEIAKQLKPKPMTPFEEMIRTTIDVYGYSGDPSELVKLISGVVKPYIRAAFIDGYYSENDKAGIAADQWLKDNGIE